MGSIFSENILKESISDVEKIVNSYYSAISNYKLESLIGPLEREFTEEDIKNILKEAGTDDPFNVPFKIVFEKYYEPEFIKTRMDNIKFFVIDLLHRLIINSCNPSYKFHRSNNAEILHDLRSIHTVTDSKYGKIAFIEWYEENKNELYDDAVVKVLVSNAINSLLLDYKHTGMCSYEYPIPYPIPNLSFLNTSGMDIPNFISNPDYHKISISEALSNIPDHLVNAAIEKAKKDYSKQLKDNPTYIDEYFQN